MVGNRTHTWWGFQIHGGLASQQARFRVGQVGFGPEGCAQGRPWGWAPLAPIQLDPHQIWPAGWHLNQDSKVSGVILNQALRKEMKTSEQTHAPAVRKVPTNSWEQGPA